MIGPSSELRLALSKLAIDIPMQKGYENGNEIYFVTFDASDKELALKITNSSNDFPVHYTKLLAQTPLRLLNKHTYLQMESKVKDILAISQQLWIKTRR